MIFSDFFDIINLRMFRSHLKEIMKKGSKFGLIGPKTVNLIYYKLLHLGVKLIIDKVIFHIDN